MADAGSSAVVKSIQILGPRAILLRFSSLCAVCVFARKTVFSTLRVHSVLCVCVFVVLLVVYMFVSCRVVCRVLV